MHAPAPAKLYWPAGHGAAVALVEPVEHAYPAVHWPLHAAVPTAAVAPYRPAAHILHAPAPAKLYWPAGHAAAVELVDPAAHAYPAVQLPLHAGDVSPVVAPKVPAGHGPVQEEVVSAAVLPYRPAGQLAHAEAPRRLNVPG